MTGELHLDAGALIALDRLDRRAWARLHHATVSEAVLPRVAAPVVGQAWRSPRQANLARALHLCEVVPATLSLARRAGELCAAAGTSDVVDALVVATAEVRGGTVLTSDPFDIGALAGHARRSIGVVHV